MNAVILLSSLSDRVKWTAEQIRALFNDDGGLLDPRIYSDPDLYELELERFFVRYYFLLGQEAHIPRADGYLAQYMGDGSTNFPYARGSSARGAVGCRAQ